jgi:hypothetical protein
MPVAPSSDFLTQKAGILPIWGWGAVGLGAAYAYSRYKANKAGQGNGTTDTTNSAGESTSSAPEFIIENNEPAGGWGSVSVPVIITTPAPVPVTTPPGTGTGPPTNKPPIHGGNPPHGPGAVGGQPPARKPTPKPVAKAPIAYKVQHGDSLSSIAAKYHTTWQALWSFNTGAQSPHSAQAKATLLKQGPNLIYAGQTIYIPQ